VASCWLSSLWKVAVAMPPFQFNQARLIALGFKYEVREPGGDLLNGVYDSLVGVGLMSG
jgi:hypothetical protein